MNHFDVRGLVFSPASNSISKARVKTTWLCTIVLPLQIDSNSKSDNPLPVLLTTKQEQESPARFKHFSPGGTGANHGIGRLWLRNEHRTDGGGTQGFGTTPSTILVQGNKEASGINARVFYPELPGLCRVLCSSRQILGNNNPRTYSRLSG